MDDALESLNELRWNEYPGRVIIVGKTLNKEHLVQIAALTGTSENSRNRRYKHDHGTVSTEPIDPAKVTNPTYTMHRAMREFNGNYVIGNGRHTDSIIDHVARSQSDGFRETMNQHSYERDENDTPRIAAICRRQERPIVRFCSITKEGKDSCRRAFYDYDDLTPGFGYCLCTYDGDFASPRPYRKSPFLVPITSNEIQKITTFFWNCLNEENRIAIATKFIRISYRETQIDIFNRY